MPDVRIFHLTDETTEALATPIRMGGDMPLVIRRIGLYAALQGDWCLVDTDVVFQKDVSHVFDHAFDVAVVERSPETKDTDYGKLIPYNLGVVFSRKPGFWRAMLPALKTLPPKLQAWDGGQLLMSYMARRNLFDVKVLPADYNWTPASETEDLSQRAIVHYKGKRPKAWLTDKYGEQRTVSAG